jgi:hypothetical protein
MSQPNAWTEPAAIAYFESEGEHFKARQLEEKFYELFRKVMREEPVDRRCYRLAKKLFRDHPNVDCTENRALIAHVIESDAEAMIEYLVRQAEADRNTA